MLIKAGERKGERGPREDRRNEGRYVEEWVERRKL